MPQPDLVPWQAAWDGALYGPSGFYRRPEGPAGHFRTASHAAGELLATAIARLAQLSGCRSVLDVGAGRGELLTGLAAVTTHAHDPGPAGTGPQSLRLHGVDVVTRPAGLPEAIGWSQGLAELPDGSLDGALLIGWELLDVIPCEVAEVDEDGVTRQVLVDPATGAESLGPRLSGPDARWCERWWPLDGAGAGARAEVGRSRDELWAGLVRRVAGTPGGGVLLAVDYAHDRDGRPQPGTLAGYRGGRLVPPVPDGSCDITAHVALDAVADAGRAAGATGTLLASQRDMLTALGVTGRPRAGPRPGPPAGPQSGAAILAALAARSQATELMDPNGLGGFGWLLQAAGRLLPELDLPASAAVRS